jgi:hypothetical protein
MMARGKDRGGSDLAKGGEILCKDSQSVSHSLNIFWDFTSVGCAVKSIFLSVLCVP